MNKRYWDTHNQKRPYTCAALEEKQKSTIKSILKFVLKIAISATALYFVYQKIEWEALQSTLLNTNLGWYLLALLAFNLSKTVAAFRTKTYYQSQGLLLDSFYNFKLYYTGMFYNLFLPGSIGGDAYKIYLLRGREVKTKNLIYCGLLDRLSGLTLLFILGVVLLFMAKVQGEYAFELKVISFVLALAALPVLYGVAHFLGKGSFNQVFWKTSWQSLWVQIGQVATATCLLLAIGVEGHFFSYLYLFMISSVVAVLPLTIGGVGARELVFLYGYEYLPIEKELAMTFTLLFFSITAISSFLGFFASFSLKNNQDAKANRIED